MDYVTCHGNGKYGTLTPAGMDTGMMKLEKHFNRVLAYVKKQLPDAHLLAAKGWRELPAGQHTLSKHVACPGGAESSDDDASAAPAASAKRYDSSGDEMPE